MAGGSRCPAHAGAWRAGSSTQATPSKPVNGSWRQPPVVHVSVVHGSPSSQPLEVPIAHEAPGNVVVVVAGGGASVVVVLDDVVVLLVALVEVVVARVEVVVTGG